MDTSIEILPVRSDFLHRGQIAEMRDQAEKDAVLEEQRIKASVEDEKRKILDSAEQEIASATVQARRQIQQYAADLAIDQAAKKLVVTAETDRLLVQRTAIGGRIQNVEGVVSYQETTQDRLKELRSSVEDVDWTQAVINLKTQEQVYQSSLYSASTMLQVSLADYLK